MLYINVEFETTFTAFMKRYTGSRSWFIVPKVQMFYVTQTLQSVVIVICSQQLSFLYRGELYWWVLGRGFIISLYWPHQRSGWGRYWYWRWQGGRRYRPAVCSYRSYVTAPCTTSARPSAGPGGRPYPPHQLKKKNKCQLQVQV